MTSYFQKAATFEIMSADGQSLRSIARKTKMAMNCARTQAYNKLNVDYTLHLKVGDKGEINFFNKY